MTIRELRVYSVALPARQMYNMSSSAVSTPYSTIIELVNSDGQCGYGEVCLASPHYQTAHNQGVIASLELLAPEIIGQDARLHNVLNARMHAVMEGHTEGKAAIDIACWDLAGKIHDCHVVDLLGGALTENVVTYHVIGIGTAEYAAAEAERLQSAGIKRLQLKAGGRSIDQDIESIHAVANAIAKDTDLAIDSNRGWSTTQALQVSNACADIAFSLEQPCATEAELLQLKTQIRHPIIIDENATDLRSIARQITTGTANGFGLKISRLGGLTAMLGVRDLCMQARIPMSADDAWGGDIIAAAGVALGATLKPDFSRGAWIAHPYHETHYDETHGPRIIDGYVTLPDGGPGLGLQIEPGYFGDPVAVYSG